MAVILGYPAGKVSKNCNRSFWELCPWYWNTIGYLTLQILIRSQSPCRISGCIEGTTKIQATYNDYSCPLIDAGGITPSFGCYLESRYIDPQGPSGKAIRGFLWHLPGSGGQLPKIEIKICLSRRSINYNDKSKYIIVLRTRIEDSGLREFVYSPHK